MELRPSRLDRMAEQLHPDDDRRHILLWDGGGCAPSDEQLAAEVEGLGVCIDAASEGS
jgi:hypothetical protein